MGVRRNIDIAKSRLRHLLLLTAVLLSPACLWQHPHHEETFERILNHGSSDEHHRQRLYYASHVRQGPWILHPRKTAHLKHTTPNAQNRFQSPLAWRFSRTTELLRLEGNRPATPHQSLTVRRTSTSQNFVPSHHSRVSESSCRLLDMSKDWSLSQLHVN